MSSFIFEFEDGIERYSFPSVLNEKQRHFIDRSDGGQWGISIVDYDEDLSLEDARHLVVELNVLTAFASKLVEPGWEPPC